MHEYLMAIDWDNFVLDNYALEEFMIDFEIPYDTFDPNLWLEVKMELGIIDMPYEVNYVLDLLEYVGYDSTTVDANLMFEILHSVDWNVTIMDNFALQSFFTDLNIDSSTFNETAWTEVLAEL